MKNRHLSVFCRASAAGVTVVMGTKPTFDPLGSAPVPPGGNPFLTGRPPAVTQSTVLARPSLARPAAASNPFAAGRLPEAGNANRRQPETSSGQSGTGRTDAFASLRQSSMGAGAVADLWLRGRRDAALRGSLGARAGLVLARRVTAARTGRASQESVAACLEAPAPTPNKLAAAPIAAGPAEAFSDAEVAALADAGCWAAVAQRLAPLFPTPASGAALGTGVAALGLSSDAAVARPTGALSPAATPARSILCLRALLQCGRAEASDRLASSMLGISSEPPEAVPEAYAVAAGLAGAPEAFLPLSVLVAHAALPLRLGRPAEAAGRCAHLCAALAAVSGATCAELGPETAVAGAVVGAWADAVCARAASLRACATPLPAVVAELEAAAAACLRHLPDAAAAPGPKGDGSPEGGGAASPASRRLVALLRRAEASAASLAAAPRSAAAAAAPSVPVPEECLRLCAGGEAVAGAAGSMLRAASDAAAGAGDAVGAAVLLARAVRCAGWSLLAIHAAATGGAAPGGAGVEGVCGSAVASAAVDALLAGTADAPARDAAASLASAAVGLGQLALGPAGAVRDAEMLFHLAIEAALRPIPPTAGQGKRHDSHFQRVQAAWPVVAGSPPAAAEDETAAEEPAAAAAAAGGDGAGPMVVGWPATSDTAALSAASNRVRLCCSAVTGAALSRLHAGEPSLALATMRDFVLAAPPVTATAATVAAAMTLTDLCRGPEASARDKDALKAAAASFGAQHAVAVA